MKVALYAITVAILIKFALFFPMIAMCVYTALTLLYKTKWVRVMAFYIMMGIGYVLGFIYVLFTSKNYSTCTDRELYLEHAKLSASPEKNELAIQEIEQVMQARYR